MISGWCECNFLVIVLPLFILGVKKRVWLGGRGRTWLLHTQENSVQVFMSHRKAGAISLGLTMVLGRLRIILS